MNRDRQVRVRCATFNPVIGKLDDNVDGLKAEMVAAYRDRIELLVLPELATSGYSLTAEEASETSMSKDDARIADLAEMASSLHLTTVFGFCETDGSRLFNCAAVLVPGKRANFYRKLHLWDSEKLLFSPGDRFPPIVSTPFGNLGVAICYDLEFPEMPRKLALNGAEIIAVPTNWPQRKRPSGERPHEVIHAMAAAQASAIAVACCDRSGMERGVSWTDGSAIVGQDGWPKGHSSSGGILDAEITLSPNRAEIGPRNDLFGDRRVDVYRLD